MGDAFPRALSDYAELLTQPETLAHTAVLKAALAIAEARRELGADDIGPLTGKLDAMHVALQTCAQAIRYRAAMRAMQSTLSTPARSE